MTENWAVPASRAQLHEQGRGMRGARPRSALGEHSSAQRDPLGILDAQDATRVPDLVPLRRERMSASPFAFYRGTAALDGGGPRGIEVEELDDGPFVTYAEACAATLARAHSQSVASARVVGYIGGGERIAQALLTWAYDYADVSLADYEAFRVG